MQREKMKKKLVIPKINSIHFGKIPYYERHLKETIPFDPQKQYAVIRSSICTGEKVAGFKSIEDGHFIEVMLIRTDKEEQRFKKIYSLETVKKEY